MRIMFTVALAAGLALIAGPGCGRKTGEAAAAANADNPAAPVAAPVAAAPADAPLVEKSRRSARFEAVNRQLELGGVLYGFVDVAGDVERLGGELTRMSEMVAAMQPQSAMWRQDYARVLAALGLTGIEAIGVSSVKAGDGFNNRVFFHVPEARRGLLAALGGAPHAFDGARLAPPDTDFYFESEWNAPAAYEAVKAVVNDVGGEGLVRELEKNLQAPTPAGVTAFEVVQQLSGRWVAFARIDAGEPIPVGGGGLMLPGVSFVVKVDGVGRALGELLPKLGALRRVDEGGRALFEVRETAPGAKMQPVLLVEGGALFVASDRAFLLESLQRKDGLDRRAEFQRALASVGGEGNGLSYVTPRTFAELRKVLESARANPQTAAMVGLWAGRLPELAAPLVSVRINLPDGVLVKSFSHESLKSQVLMMSSGSPVTIGLLAAMAIPAFEKVRESSREKAVQNNLRLFVAAAQQHMLETGKRRVAYGDVVGPDKLITTLQPVAGESYRTLIVRDTDRSISVRTAAGKTVTHAW